MIVKCEHCGKEFKTFPQRIKIGKAKFCSKECAYADKHNRISKNCLTCNKEFIIKPSRIKYGLGKYCSKNCFYERPDKPREEKHHCWKGDKVGYSAMHDWIIRQKGRPKICEHCGTTTAKKFEWANVSGEYKREISDWIRLCTKCHIAFDGSIVTGEDNGQSKLTEKQVIEIRKLYEHNNLISYENLAHDFKISKAAIHKIITRKTWKHI